MNIYLSAFVATYNGVSGHLEWEVPADAWIFHPFDRSNGLQGYRVNPNDLEIISERPGWNLSKPVDLHPHIN